MLVLRVLAILAVIAVVGGFVAFLLSGDRRYLSFSWKIFRYSLAIGLLLFVLLAAERLLIIPV